MNGNLTVHYGQDFNDNLVKIQQYLSDKLHIIHVTEKQLSVIAQAFTTPGYSKENTKYGDYNRLEFLGDAFIKSFLSRFVFESYPDLQEGKMSKICHYLWNDKCYPESLRLYGASFTDIILMPNSEKNQGREHKTSYVASVTADCFEALIGALDISGFHDESESFMKHILTEGLFDLVNHLQTLPIEKWDYHLNCLANEKVNSFKSALLF